MIQPQSRNASILLTISEIILAIGYLSFSFALYIASQFPGNGLYELNIYEAYPLSFWILFLLAGFCSIFWICIETFYLRRDYQWVWGTVLLAIITVFIISIPIFRFYAFNGQYDTIVHYSWSLEIFENGIPWDNDFYPLLHVITAALAKASGFSVLEVILFSPLLYYLIGVINMVFLAINVSKKPEVQGLIISIAILPIYSFYQTMFFPVFISIYQLWLFFALYYRSREKARTIGDRIFFILTLFFLPFLHPLGVFGVIILLVSSFAFEILLKIKSKEKNKSFSTALNNIIPPILIIFISWFTWFSTFRVFGISIRTIYEAFFNEISGQDLLSNYISAANRGNLDITQILRLVIFSYGPIVIFGLLTGGLLIALLVKKISLEKWAGYVLLFVFTFYIIGGVSLIRELITAYPSRYINYSLGFLGLILGSGLIGLFDASKNLGRTAITIIAVVSIFIGFGIGSFNVHFSEYIGGSNNEFSYAQYEGIKFLFSNSEKNVEGIYSLVGGQRIFYALMPYGELVEFLYYHPNWRINFPPAHFGYQGSPDAAGYEFVDQEYLFATAFELGYYQLWSTEGRYTQEDFLLFSDDYRWNKIYESEDFIIWVWRGEKEISSDE